MLRIDKRSPIPRHLQLQEGIKRMIVARGLRPGDRIPPERQLVCEAAVSRNTVREAVTQLVHQGVLLREKVKGTFVRRVPTLRFHEARRFGFALCPSGGVPSGLELACAEVLRGFLSDRDRGDTVTVLLSPGGAQGPGAAWADDLHALLAFGAVSEPVLRRFVRHIPHVVALPERPLPSAYNRIALDRAAGARMATELLLTEGCASVALVVRAPRKARLNAALARGCDTALRTHGHGGPAVHAVRGDTECEALVAQLLGASHRPFGILLAGRSLLEAGLRAYHRARRKARKDVTLAGYIEGPAPPAETVRPARVVGISPERCGRAAFALLADLSAGIAKAPAERSVAPELFV